MTLAHEDKKLIEPVEMRRAYPLRIGLEVGPDEQHAEVIGSECSDRIEIALDRVLIPVIPAEPPVVRGGIVHAEPMAQGIEAGRLRRFRTKCAGEPFALNGDGTNSCRTT